MDEFDFIEDEISSIQGATQEALEEPWEVQRLGMVTGSNFGKLVKTAGKGFKLSESKTASDLIYKIAWERLLKQGNISNGLGRLNVSARPMEYGNEYEAEAMAVFVERTGTEVKYVQDFVQHDEFIGGTPDGYIDEDGIIEIKCPWNGANHLYSLLEEKIYATDHIYQIQGYLWITGRKYCKYITYDPDLIEELQLNVIHVDRDEEIINGISEVMQEVKTKIIEILEHQKLKLK